MLISAGIMVIVFGLICLFDSELAWLIHEMDARFVGRTARRSSHWETHMMLQGFCMIVAGGLGVMVGAGLIG